MTAARRLARLAPPITLAFAALLVLWWRNRGFDGTDEAYYIAWTIDPSRYDVSIHPAGLFWNVTVWRWTQSVAALRMAGFVLLVSAGAALGAQLGRYYTAAGVAFAPRRAALLTAALMPAFYFHGILTPGYNLLALAGACLAGAGLLAWPASTLQRATSLRDDATAAIAAGSGAALTFLGKPPLAVMLAVAATACLVPVARRAPARAIVIATITAVACFGPLLLILAVSVSVSGFVDTVVAGRAVLDFNNSAYQLLARIARDLLQAPLYIAAPLTALVLALAAARDGEIGRSLRLAIACVLALALLGAVYSTARAIANGAEPWAALGPGAFALAAAFVAWGVARTAERRVAVLAPVGVLLAAPLLIGFGTANDWWQQIGMSFPPLLLAVVLAARILLPRCRAWSEAAACAACAAMLAWAAHAPYRLAAGIAGQTEPITLPMSGERWYVDPATAALAQGLARAAPADAGTPLVDLGNQGPGIALLTGMRAPFFPWLNANFGNARRLADAAWNSLTPAERRRAWFVVPVAPALADSAAARYLRQNRSLYVAAVRVRQPLAGATLVIVRPR